MKQNFDAFIPHLLKSEGGYSNHPADKGGPTMKGVTIGTFTAYRRANGRGTPTVADLKNISMDEVEDIYRWQYWAPVWGDKLPAGLDVAVFDYAVNSGPAQALRTLQRAVGVGPDGSMGVNTLSAVEAAMSKDEVGTIAKYQAGRLSFMKGLRNWPSFAGGWTDRVQKVKNRAIAIAKGDSTYGMADAPVTPKANPTETAIPKAGPIITGTGTIGTVAPTIIEQAGVLKGLAQYMPWIAAVCTVLIVIGIGIMVYGQFNARREGRLS